MDVYVCVRRTLDWSGVAHVEAHLEPSLRPKVERWNAIFEMSHAAFRARLEAITERNLERMEGARRASPDELPGEGALVVPADGRKKRSFEVRCSG